MRTRPLSTLLAVATLLAAVGTIAAQASGTCASAAHPGGEWRSFGHDLSNTRSQPLESVIDPAAAGGLTAKWALSAAETGSLGNFQSNAVIADGCAYVATSAGTVYAVNADSGDLVWQTQVGGAGILAGSFALSVVDGVVYGLAGAGEDGPFAYALDQATGASLWTTSFDDPGNASGINASAVVFDGLVFAATFGGDGDPTSHPPYYILDAGTGEILEQRYVIPLEDFEQGYAGGGMWSTAVVDTEMKYAYVGTTNPYSKSKEHAHSNAIIKIDMDRNRATFGDIVDSYKGTPDNYESALYDQPACQEAGDVQTAGYSLLCAQLDVDFGASPNLFTDGNGRTLVGDLQKSGVYHAAYADTMEEAWSTTVSAPYAGGNASTAATDGESIYVAAFPGIIEKLDADTGAIAWATPMPDPVHYQSVSVAGGVVYVMDNKGALNTFDAETGLPGLPILLGPAVNDICTSLSGGVAIARNLIYATCDVGVGGGGWTVALGVA